MDEKLKTGIQKTSQKFVRATPTTEELRHPTEEPTPGEVLQQCRRTSVRFFQSHTARPLPFEVSELVRTETLAMVDLIHDVWSLMRKIVDEEHISTFGDNEFSRIEVSSNFSDYSIRRHLVIFENTDLAADEFGNAINDVAMWLSISEVPKLLHHIIASANDILNADSKTHRAKPSKTKHRTLTEVAKHTNEMDLEDILASGEEMAKMTQRSLAWFVWAFEKHYEEIRSDDLMEDFALSSKAGPVMVKPEHQVLLLVGGPHDPDEEVGGAQ